MNKKPISYLQTDKRWKNEPYRVKGENATVGSSGCGPTAAAMLISTITGKTYTPVDACKWSVAHGYKALKAGTYYAYFKPQFAAFGIDCDMMNWKKSYGNPDHPNHAKMLEMLKAGYYIIALMGPGLWTSGGHFVVVWWENGKICINDPASTKPARLNGDPRTFFSQVNYYWWIDAREFNAEQQTVPPAVETEKPAIHVVTRGQTLGAIAKDAGTTVAELVRINGIKNPNLIYVDQVIMLEETARAAAEKLATMGIIAEMTYWTRKAQEIKYLDILLIQAAKVAKRTGRRAASAKAGVEALVAAGVINTLAYWLGLVEQKTPNMGDLLRALGGAV